MRRPFLPPTVREFERLFSPSTTRGAGLDDIRLYNPYNRGGGLLSFLAGLAKRALPFLVNTIAPEGVSLAQNIMKDVQTGQKNMREALKTRGVESLRNVGSKLSRGGGGKKVKRLKKRKSCFNDVFSVI